MCARVEPYLVCASLWHCGLCLKRAFFTPQLLRNTIYLSVLLQFQLNTKCTRYYTFCTNVRCCCSLVTFIIVVFAFSHSVEHKHGQHSVYNLLLFCHFVYKMDAKTHTQRQAHTGSQRKHKRRPANRVIHCFIGQPYIKSHSRQPREKNPARTTNCVMSYNDLKDNNPEVYSGKSLTVMWVVKMVIVSRFCIHISRILPGPWPDLVAEQRLAQVVFVIYRHFFLRCRARKPEWHISSVRRCSVSERIDHKNERERELCAQHNAIVKMYISLLLCVCYEPPEHCHFYNGLDEVVKCHIIAEQSLHTHTHTTISVSCFPFPLCSSTQMLYDIYREYTS